MKSPLRGRLYLSYLAMVVPAIIAVIAIAAVTMNTVSRYLSNLDMRLSESIASHVLSEFTSAVSGAQQLAIVYGTDENFIPELRRLLNQDMMDYDSLNTLRSIQRNVRMDFLTRPYISAIYFFPSQNGRMFLAAPDGVYPYGGHPDSAFIQEAVADDGYEGLIVRKGGYWNGNLISYIYRDPIQKGTIIVNIDLDYLSYIAESYITEWPDSYFEVSFNDSLVTTGGRKPVEPDVSGSVRLDDVLGFSIVLYQSSSALVASNAIMASTVFIAALLIAFIGLVVVVVITHEKYRDYAKAGDYVRKIDEIGLMMQRDQGYQSRFDDIESYVRLHLTQSELKERHLELETLKHQLNPHIVMNTLQMLNWQLMREQKGHTALNTLVENLCRILSYSLYPSESLATLSDEVAYTDSYIALQYRKSPVGIDWERPIPDTLVPRMILQPIIENALKYAFAGISEPKIHVGWRIMDRVIEIDIADNGIGIAESQLRAVRMRLAEDIVPEGSGIGLYNTNKRIQLMFGRSFGLDINSQEGSGTSVVIRLPVTQMHKE